MLSRIIEEEKSFIFVRLVVRFFWFFVFSILSEEFFEMIEDSEDRFGKEFSVFEKKEDVLMFFKFRLKRRWNDDFEVRELSKNGKFFWNGLGFRGLVTVVVDV